MKKTRVLITGASGFIGGNLFEELSKKEGLGVIGAFCNSFSIFRDRWWVSDELLLKADLINKADAFRVTEGVDVVIHAAAISAGAKYIVEDPGFLLDNTTINTNILQAAYANNVKHFIFLSCSVLYPMDLGRPVKEGDVDYSRIHPKYHAGAWVKIYGEKLCEFYAARGRTRFTVIRHSNIFGPHDKFDLDRSHVLGATVAKVMMAKDGGEIVIWGDGKGQRDFLHVNDLTRFIEKVINPEWRFEIFNVGMGQAISVRELTAKIVAASGKDLAMRHDSAKPSIGGINLAMDINKSKQVLGWAPLVDLDDGIGRTLDWYRSNYHEKL